MADQKNRRVKLREDGRCKTLMTPMGKKIGLGMVFDPSAFKFSDGRLAALLRDKVLVVTDDDVNTTPDQDTNAGAAAALGKMLKKPDKISKATPGDKPDMQDANPDEVDDGNPQDDPGGFTPAGGPDETWTNKELQAHLAERGVPFRQNDSKADLLALCAAEPD